MIGGSLLGKCVVTFYYDFSWSDCMGLYCAFAAKMINEIFLDQNGLGWPISCYRSMLTMDVSVT